MVVINTFYKQMTFSNNWPVWFYDIWFDPFEQLDDILRKYNAYHKIIMDDNDYRIPMTLIITFTTEEGYVKFCLERM